MPSVLPFAGLRYTQRAGELERLLSPPYDVIAPREQAELEAASPYNAVHLELPSDAPDRPGSRYALAAEELAAWREKGILGQDDAPSYYLSATEFEYGGQTYQRRDLIGALALEPWSAETVLPHEQTMPAPKQDRLDLLRSTHLNVSPIWVLQRETPDAVSQAWASAEQRPPEIDIHWRGERHRLWRISDPSMVAAVQQAFESAGPLYIADGHHRYETCLAFRDEAHSVKGAAGVLAAITQAEDPGLLVLPTHRLLLHLDGRLGLEDVETEWADIFHVEYYPIWEDAPPEQIDALMQQLASTGRLGPAFGIVGLGHLDLFGLLELRGRKPPPDALPSDRSDAWKSLDVALLHALVLDRIVAETGLRRDDVLAYTRDPHAAFDAVRTGEASAAVFLNPTPVSSVLAVADAHDRMPEKSTYFYPKPPAGLVMRDLDQ
ncbi:MAG: DUF1015 domain-containing protein [Chloroflexi bacterium]|nr:DUF1015 domain-containing protein [Chloroflexota bacterium]